MMTMFDLVKFFAIGFSIVGVFIFFYVLLGSSEAVIFVLITLSILFLLVYGTYWLLVEPFRKTKGGK